MRAVLGEAAWSVCLTVSAGHDRESCKIAEPIDVPFGYRLVWAGRWNHHALDGDKHARHLANTIVARRRRCGPSLFIIIIRSIVVAK